MAGDVRQRCGWAEGWRGFHGGILWNQSANHSLYMDSQRLRLPGAGVKRPEGPLRLWRLGKASCTIGDGSFQRTRDPLNSTAWTESDLWIPCRHSD